ncbi:MAG: septum formation initiator family protein [Acidobacteria bacterium]|nr:septum formation initiator family protein [Acidobacteriota bacterium]
MSQAPSPRSPRRSDERRKVRPGGGPPSRRWAQVALGFVAALLIVNALIGDRGYFQLHEVKRDHAHAVAELAQARQRNAALRERARRLRDDPQAIEEAARRELGLMKRDEFVFIVRDVPPTAAARP